MPRMFGTDGVRGIANTELTGNLAYDLGRAGAQALTQGTHKPTVILGSDTRRSCDLLKCALMAGICSVGAHAVDLGVLPTPAIALLTRQMCADAGVVISASHNPAKYNGIKFFNREGYKLSDALEDEIEALVRGGCAGVPSPTGAELGRIETRPEMRDEYLEALVQRAGADLSGLTIALDCANGAASRVAPELFARLGARVVSRACEPDGMNINLDCGSTHPEALQALVVESGADVGLAFDGDADRLIVCDNLGRIVDGDKTIAICARMLKREGRLAENKVTATVMSNIGFHKAMEAAGIDVDVTGVGDRYVLERMLETGCVLGGEQSGHIIFREFATTGDGTLSSLQFVKAVLEDGRAVSEIADEIRIYPQVLVNAKINNDYKKTYSKDAEVAAAIQALESKMQGNGRVLIRPSGTEPLVRVMLEGSDLAVIRPLAEELAALIERRLGE